MPPLNIPWRMVYSRTKVLTDEQSAIFAKKYKLAPENILRLEKVLNMAISRYQLTSDRGQRTLSLRKGKEKFEAALKSIGDSCKKTEAAIAALRAINMQSNTVDASNDIKSESPIEMLETARAISGRAHYLLSEERKKGMSLLLIGPADARRNQDERRELIIEALIQYWREMGRRDGFNTNEKKEPNTAEGGKPLLVANASGNLPRVRGGNLLNFIRDAVELITDPPMRLEAEAIKKAISESRKAKAEAESAAARRARRADRAKGI